MNVHIEGAKIVDDEGHSYDPFCVRYIRPHRLHYQFVPTWSERWWVIIGKSGRGVARKYKNFHAVVGGSGHNSVAYSYRRRGLKW